MDITNELRILIEAIDVQHLNITQRQAYDRIKSALEIRAQEQKLNPDHWVFYQ